MPLQGGGRASVRSPHHCRRDDELLPQLDCIVRYAEAQMLCASHSDSAVVGGGGEGSSSGSSDGMRARCPLVAVQRDLSALVCTRPGCLTLLEADAPRRRCKGCGARYCRCVRAAVIASVSDCRRMTCRALAANSHVCSIVRGVTANGQPLHGVFSPSNNAHLARLLHAAMRAHRRTGCGTAACARRFGCCVRRRRRW